jgi:hypothetical protein
MKTALTNTDPIPLNAPAIRFDYDLLPPTLRQIVKAFADQYQIDPVIPFGTALGCVATATRGRVRTLISPSWVEHSSIYFCNIAQTADGKSQVMNKLRAPLIAYEIQIQADAKTLFQLKQAEHEIAQAKLKAIKDSRSNLKKSNKSSPATQAELLAAIDEVESTKPDPIPMLLCGGDVTPDRLTELLQEHKSLGILDAEGTLFSHLSGKKHNTGAAYETLLQATSGDQIKVHRIGRGDGVVDDPHLVICTSVQPDVWKELHGNASATNRGVTGRFMVLVAQSNIGWRDTHAHTKYPIDVELLDRWEKMLLGILNSEQDRVIELTSSGQQQFQVFRNQWEKKLRDPEVYRDGFGTRLPGNLIRIATLFTLSENPDARCIDDDALHKAICLADTYLDHRVRADELKIERIPEARILDKVATWMDKYSRDVRDVNRAYSFSTHELQQAIKQQAWVKEGKMPAIKAALANLEKWLWLESDGDERWYPRGDLLKLRW